jgi:uncharacterized protein YjbJ (UPF0337 family)
MSALGQKQSRRSLAIKNERALRILLNCKNSSSKPLALNGQSSALNRERFSSLDVGAKDRASPRPSAVYPHQQLEAPVLPELGLSSQRRAAMDWDRVQGSWKQLTGRVKEKWGKLTDDDLTAINGRRDQLEGKIQERYGSAKDQVRRDVDDWLSGL